MSITVDEAFDLIKKKLIVSVELFVYIIVFWCWYCGSSRCGWTNRHDWSMIQWFHIIYQTIKEFEKRKQSQATCGELLTNTSYAVNSNLSLYFSLFTISLDILLIINLLDQLISNISHQPHQIILFFPIQIISQILKLFPQYHLTVHSSLAIVLGIWFFPIMIIVGYVMLKRRRML